MRSFAWVSLVLVGVIASLGVVGCGSTGKGAQEPGAGEAAADASINSVWGGGVKESPYGAGGEPVEGGGPGMTPAGDAGVPPAGDAGPAAPSPYSFELKNEGDGDLSFSVDKGWQPVIFAYTGKPPKAKSALLFPTACTNSCDVPVEEMCPVCNAVEEDPKKRKAQELEETKREIATPGMSVSVPWDGQVYVYEKAPKAAKKRGCKCWRKQAPAPETYTVKACGLRPPKKAGESSRPVCAQTQVALPAATTPFAVPLTFGK